MKNEIQKKLEVEFERIRNDFFPRWDPKRKWKAKAGFQEGVFHLDILCSCDRHDKTIWIAPAVVEEGKHLDGFPLSLVLIHEICHAVSNQSHGEKFLTALKKRKDMAKKLGRREEYEAISMHLRGFELKVYTISDSVYEMARETAKKKPPPTYSKLLDLLNQSFGITTEEVDHFFPNMRWFYDRKRHKYRW